MILNWVGDPNGNSSLSYLSPTLFYNGFRRPPLHALQENQTNSRNKSLHRIILWKFYNCVACSPDLWFLFFDEITENCICMQHKLLKLRPTHYVTRICPESEALCGEGEVDYCFSNYLNLFNNIFLNEILVWQRSDILLLFKLSKSEILFFVTVTH